jgi:hypothetical protein
MANEYHAHSMGVLSRFEARNLPCVGEIGILE